MTDEQIAQLFHEQYELLAPSFGYSTREESRKPWTDVPPENKALMVAVCGKVREELMRPAIAAPQIIEIETTPIHIDFESTAAKYRTDIIKALHDAGAPMCHEDGQLMSAVEQINWLAARSTIAAPAQELAYPEGEVVGPCVCGSWPGGKCFKCPRVAAATQEPVAYLSRDGKNSMTVRDFKEHLNSPRWRWVIEKYWTDAIPLGPISATPASTAAPAVPEGFVLVPIEPTPEMMQAAWDKANELWRTPEADDPLPGHQYRAMLAAAPKPDA